MSIINQSYTPSGSKLGLRRASGSLSGARLGLVAALSLCAGFGVSLASAQQINEQGWTVLEPSEDTRFIFVSASSGNDLNSGYSPAKAVKSFERAKELIRADSADWMLLKRGDVWHEGIGDWKTSGRSAEERLVIASYGDAEERPKLLLSTENGIKSGSNDVVNHVAIIGLHFEGDRAVDVSTRGIRWLASGENFLIEDCYIAGFKDNVTIEATGGQFYNFAMRRSVIVDAWSTDGHSQGLFMNRVTGSTIQENVFDHNGWNESFTDAGASQFNQNIYIQEGVTGVEFLGNITTRASGAGVQMRSGGNAIDNLIYANPLGMRFGYRTVDWPNEQATGNVIGNVVLGGPLSDPAGDSIGLWIERVADTQVRKNVVAHFHEVAVARDSSVTRAITLNGFARNVEITENVVYDWSDDLGNGLALKSSVREGESVSFINNQWFMPGIDRLLSVVDSTGMNFSSNEVFGVESNEDVFHIDGSVMNYDEWNEQSYVGHDDLESPVFPDPRGRDLDMYAQHLGLADADAFIESARNQSRSHWDQELTGWAAAEWIRAGYIVQD